MIDGMATFQNEIDALGKTPLLRDDFQRWLETQEPRRPIGLRADCSHCPIREFIRSRIHDWYYRGKVRTDGETWTLTNWSCGTYPLPVWAKEFIRLVDEGTENTTVTARFCLHLLSLVEE